MRARTCRLHAKRDLRIEEQEVSDVGPNDVMVDMARGGICGSDLHYYHHGGFGPVRVLEPIILGHEVAGVVSRVGQAVERIGLGDREHGLPGEGRSGDGV